MNDPMAEIQAGFHALHRQTSHLVNSVSTTVSRTKLIEALKANRSKHVEEHQMALKGWREQFLVHLTAQIECLEADDWARFQIPGALARPPSFVHDYDVALKMFEMSVDEEIELDGPQFQAFVMDDWGWKAAFTANVANYSKAF